MIVRSSTIIVILAFLSTTGVYGPSVTIALGDVQPKLVGTYCTLCGRLIPAGQTCPHMGGGGWVDSGPSYTELLRQEASRLNAQGIQYMNNNDYRLAFDTFKAALDKWPDSAEIRSNLEKASALIAALEVLKEQKESQQRKAAFEKIKQDVLSSMKIIMENELELRSSGIGNALGLKGVSENELGLKGFDTGGDLGLKGLEDIGSSSLRLRRFGNSTPPARDAQITNPQIAKIMKGLRSIEVPPPLPRETASFSWKSLALSDETSEMAFQTGDITLLAWDLTGTLGSKVIPPCRVLFIAGKIFIAGEEGAYVHLVKQDKVYEEALYYLKNPATSRQFVEIVRDLKEKGRAPESANTNMVRAASAILDPSLGSSGMRIAWDSMLSPEAGAAMVRKACMEIGAELVSAGTEGLLTELTKREQLYETARLYREQAQHLLKETTDPIERRELQKIIATANDNLGKIYRLEQTGPLIGGYLEAIHVGSETEKTSGKPSSREE